MTEYEIAHGLSQDAPGPLEPVSTPTSHPIPTGATGDRDWELSCDECNGSGHVFVKHQVAERKTDVQEFKEECETCEGRGFNIAFEDIPGIAEYVKSCRADAGAMSEDERQAFEAWWRRTRGLTITKQHYFELPEVYSSWEAYQAGRASVGAPAAGDALPTIKGAYITGGYVVVTTRGWDADRAVKVRDAILRLFPVDPTFTPKPEDAIAQQKGEA
ncbi:DnaJ central domain protein [compost metagenome]